jgi:hypothetical protein
VIKDGPWLKKTFISIVQQRGAAIIKARGASSAASAANAAIDTVWSLVHPTLASDWHSIAVCSDGSYEVEKGLMSSFPIRTVGDAWEIVQNVRAERRKSVGRRASGNVKRLFHKLRKSVSRAIIGFSFVGMTRSNKSDSVTNVLVHDYDGLNLERFMGDSCPRYSGNQEFGREPSASTY